MKLIQFKLFWCGIIDGEFSRLNHNFIASRRNIYSIISFLKAAVEVYFRNLIRSKEGLRSEERLQFLKNTLLQLIIQIKMLKFKGNVDRNVLSGLSQKTTL